MLGVLREVDQESAATAPPVGVDDLDTLLGGARASGLTVQITVEGERRRLPPAMGLTLYRIVQESLSNAASHAARSQVAVRLRYEREAVDLSVRDDGGDTSGRPDLDGLRSGRGQGLLGMRERVAVFGGTLDAGPLADGGFGVHARLPVRGEPA
ncbi:MAG: hypothetical protein H0V49_03055 [Nocardioidaceae bacterium]|nr:hypothetical protein [Nocardioidaceae bacterium]